ncbi:hypothetical protein DCM91_03920 [Chitinophaga costaii]|nr:hypothetical protein DCM91_03920 [Chitinophaga costaii]
MIELLIDKRYTLSKILGRLIYSIRVKQIVLHKFCCYQVLLTILLIDILNFVVDLIETLLTNQTHTKASF